MNFVVRAPAKVNLCLFVGPTRPDGRHELVTLLESVSLADELWASVRPRPPDTVRCDELDDPNLAAVALERLRARGWEGPPLEVELAKQIPVAGGMGGGSADAAAVLRLASALEVVPDQTLAELAAELGSDVPSQLTPGLALGTGAGERVRSVEPLAPHALLIVRQPYRLATREVYAETDRLGLPRDRAELEQKRDRVLEALSPGARLPSALLVNELEPAALSLLPQVGEALAALRDAGADHALVSGSGPTVFGLFWGEDSDERAARSEADLRIRFPDTTTAVPVGAAFGQPRPTGAPEPAQETRHSG
jgi:4-diphosphocytidyl-2-C-methyl-D-erythritol kinase